jgi:hypothetical protein
MTNEEQRGKNPYNNDTPEWQLFENMQNNLVLVSTHLADAERSRIKATQAREKAERYRIALEKLTRLEDK